MTTPAPVPSPRPLRVAVVGVGHLGRHHLRKYAAVEGVRLVAAVDPSPAAREWAVKNASVPATESLGDIIGRVDAVTVATPTAHHLEVALPLIEAGIHVLVEKPITTTVAEARRLIEAARRRGVVLQIGH
ncbi:MAG: Gfo/Idh/MocA family oxidoreductase, partial [Planctomycetes bacterium]|nr:Gfo/Idh/MocA family oxidoreductase [Planctomycetota bacterium]